jgi:hypothetical protein
MTPATSQVTRVVDAFADTWNRHEMKAFARLFAVRFPSPRLANARSRWQLEGHVSPDGQPLPPRTGLLLNVLVSEGREWSIIDSQNTDIVEGVLSRPQ